MGCLATGRVRGITGKTLVTFFVYPWAAHYILRIRASARFIFFGTGSPKKMKCIPFTTTCLNGPTQRHQYLPSLSYHAISYSFFIAYYVDSNTIGSRYSWQPMFHLQTKKGILSASAG